MTNTQEEAAAATAQQFVQERVTLLIAVNWKDVIALVPMELPSADNDTHPCARLLILCLLCE